MKTVSRVSKKSASRSSAADLRVESWKREDTYGSGIDGSDNDSVETFESLVDLVDAQGPWYLRGRRTIEIDYVHYSDKDDSTASEDEALGESEDDVSSSDVTSSSEDEEISEMGNNPETEVSEVVTEMSNESIVSVSTSTSETQLSSKTDDESRGQVSFASPLTLTAHEEDSEYHEAAHKYATKPGPEIEKFLQVLDFDKWKHASNRLINQKMFIFESDMSEFLTSNKRQESVMMETLRGAIYWKIRKVLKFLKLADQDGTALALSILLDCELSNVENHTAFHDTGGMEMLINLLTVDEHLCRVKSLQVIDILTDASGEMCELALDLGVIDEIQFNLSSMDEEEVLTAVKCLMNIVCIKRSRTVFRKKNLIPFIFQLVHRTPLSVLREKLCEIHFEGHMRYEIALGALYIVTSLMKSPVIRGQMFESGYLSIAIPLVQSKETAVVRAILDGLVLCASLKQYRVRFEIAHLVKKCLAHWAKHEELVLRFIYKKMAIGIEGREQILECNGLSRAIAYIKDGNNLRNSPYGFKYALGCLHRMGVNAKARAFFNKEELLIPLVGLLKVCPQPYQLLICGIISQMSISPENWPLIVSYGGLEEIMKLMLNRVSDVWLLAHCLKVLTDVAHSPSARSVLAQHPETMSYLLSLLDDERPMITRFAARALVPLTRIYSDYAEIMKSDLGSLEVALDRLGSENDSVKSAVCEALAACMSEETILCVVQDMGLKHQICKIIDTDNESLQENVCLLISMCLNNPLARIEFGKVGIVERLANFLTSPNVHIVIASLAALWRLTYDSDNALKLYNTGVVQKLLQFSSSKYEEVSSGALGCLQNIRQAALKHEIIKEKGEGNESHLITPPREFPYIFKPQLFFHEDIEL